MSAPAVHDPELVRLLEAAVARVRAGETLGLGLIEVQRDGVVAIAAEAPGYYHELHSGVARLAVRLALQEQTLP